MKTFLYMPTLSLGFEVNGDMVIGKIYNMSNTHDISWQIVRVRGRNPTCLSS